MISIEKCCRKKWVTGIRVRVIMRMKGREVSGKRIQWRGRDHHISKISIRGIDTTWYACYTWHIFAKILSRPMIPLSEELAYSSKGLTRGTPSSASLSVICHSQQLHFHVQDLFLEESSWRSSGGGWFLQPSRSAPPGTTRNHADAHCSLKGIYVNLVRLFGLIRTMRNPH